MTAEAEIEVADNGQKLVRYSPSDAAIAELASELTGLKADTPAGYKRVQQAIATTRGHRVAIEKRRVQLKADALEWGRKVDSEAKRLTSMLLEIEEPLKAVKAAVDDEKERIKREAEESERARVEAGVRAKREEEEARLKAERDVAEARLKAERERLDAERKAMEAEKAKAAAEQAERDRAARIEHARIAAENAEAARILKETQAKLDEQLRAAEAAAQAEQKRIEAERRKIEADRLAAERAERDRIEAEQRKATEEAMAATESKRLESLRPDSEKITAYGKAIFEVPLPAVKTPEATAFVKAISSKVVAIAAQCKRFLEPTP